MSESYADDIEALSHWSRVAFATRCAQLGFPLYQRHWPAAPVEYRERLQQAIELAAQSAANGTPAFGLDQASMHCVIAAGAAIAPCYATTSDTAAISQDDNRVIASYAAKIAELASKAAMSPPANSARAAIEAFVFLIDTSQAARDSSIEATILLDLHEIRDRTEGWDDQTPVPATIFPAPQVHFIERK